MQDELRGRVVLDEPGPPPGTGRVTGVDVAYDDERDVVVAAAVVLDAASLTVVAEATAVGQVSFPYVPGCSPSARSRPCWPCSTRCRARRVSWSVTATVSPTPPFRPRQPPRRPHRAPHHRVAKNPFTFSYEEPGARRGSASPLLAGEPTGLEEVGRALRTQDGVKPVFVSVGHRVSLDNACAHTLALTPRYRLPETTRRADSLCRRALKETTPSGASPVD